MTDEDWNPDWAPLRSALSIEDCDYWMWMGRKQQDGATIEQYKHINTRQYLNLDQDGQAWTAVLQSHGCGGPFCETAHEHIPDVWGYAKIPLDRALEWALS